MKFCSNTKGADRLRNKKEKGMSVIDSIIKRRQFLFGALGSTCVLTCKKLAAFSVQDHYSAHNKVTFFWVLQALQWPISIHPQPGSGTRQKRAIAAPGRAPFSHAPPNQDGVYFALDFVCPAMAMYPKPLPVTLQ